LFTTSRWSRLSRLLLIGEHTCPWWLAYSFDNPLRRLIHPPQRLLGQYVTEGMTVLDVGCGMGHFSLGMARMVGPDGKVLAVDLQPEMLGAVSRRAARRGLTKRIAVHRCSADGLGVTASVDFILTFWMAHEVADVQGLMEELFARMREGGRYLLAEPWLHVSAERFEAISAAAIQAGFERIEAPSVALSRAAVFGRAR